MTAAMEIYRYDTYQILAGIPGEWNLILSVPRLGQAWDKVNLEKLEYTPRNDTLGQRNWERSM